MNPTDKEIIEKFREEFSGLSQEAFDAMAKGEDVGEAKKKAVEQFILDSLKLQRQKIREEIEKLRPPVAWEFADGWNFLEDEPSRVYNEALNRLLQSDLLKDEQ